MCEKNGIVQIRTPKQITATMPPQMTMRGSSRKENCPCDACPSWRKKSSGRWPGCRTAAAGSCRLQDPFDWGLLL